MRIHVVGIVLLLYLGPALGQTLTKDGFINPGSGDPVWRDGRQFADDRSFESGNCQSGSEWTCWSTTSCEWIVNPVDSWGYPAWDGLNAAWLGGFCDGKANNNSFCQEFFNACWYLDFYFSSYINSACSQLTITMNGQTVFSRTMSTDDHNFGNWERAPTYWGLIDITAFIGVTSELCFQWTACGEDTDGDGYPDEDNDNMLIDWIIGDICESPTEVTSFSTVKALY